MKKFIKIITIFGMLTFASSVHSMEQELFYTLHMHILKKMDPFSENFPIFVGKKHPNNLSVIKKNLNFKKSILNTLYHRSIALQLATIKFFNEKNEKILRTIYDAVSEETPVTTMYNISQDKLNNMVNITPSQISISVYKLIENLFEDGQFADEDKKRKLIVTILKGRLNRINREKKLSSALTNGTRDELEIDVPEDIIHLLLSYLPKCNLDEEKNYSPKLLAQVQKEFDE